MRRILFFNFLTILAVSCFGQKFTPVTLEPPRQVDSNAPIRFNCRSYSQSNQPLYIIDGSLSDSSTISSLNPQDILRIDILKEANATALYGYRATAGVIIISTKRSKFLVIEDEDNRSPLEGASVKFFPFTEKKDSIVLIAGKNGKVDLKSVFDNRREYKIEISCIGYKTKSVILAVDSNRVVQLQRDYKKLNEVIVVGYLSLRRTHCCICGTIVKTTYSGGKREDPQRNNLLIYPNPVCAGSMLTVSVERNNDLLQTAQLLSSSGQLISQLRQNEKELGVVNLQIPSNLSAGIYFLEMVTKSKQIKTVKVVITK